MARRSAGAVDAAHGAGIALRPGRGDVLAASGAEAGLPLLEPRQRRVDRPEAARAPGLPGVRHRLRLQGILAGRPPHGRPVAGHRPAAFAGGGGMGGHLRMRGVAPAAAGNAGGLIGHACS